MISFPFLPQCPIRREVFTSLLEESRALLGAEAALNVCVGIKWSQLWKKANQRGRGQKKKNFEQLVFHHWSLTPWCG